MISPRVHAGRSPTPFIPLQFQISSPYGHQLHFNGESSGGRFGFTSKESGQYMACFWVPHHERTKTVMVDLHWNTGMAAKELEGVATKDRIDVSNVFSSTFMR